MLRRLYTPFTGVTAARVCSSTSTASSAAFVAAATSVSATAAASGGAFNYTPVRRITKETADAAAGLLKAQKVWNNTTVDKFIKEYTTFGMPESYEAYFTTEEITEHIRTFMCICNSSPTTKFDFFRERDKYAFYWCEDDFRSQLETVKKMEGFITDQMAKFPGHGVSVASYSTVPCESSGNRACIFYGCQIYPFIDASGDGTTLESVATKEFLSRKRSGAKIRYQTILDQLRTAIGPVFTISEPLEDGSTVFTVAVNDERLGHLSALVTMLSHIKGSHVSRTFCESFADRSQVYSIFVKGATDEDLRRIGTNFGLLPKRPRHPLMEAYKNNAIGYEQVIFGHAMMIFCQYFTPAMQSDDFIELQRALKSDEARLKRLLNMRSASTQELVTDYLAGSILGDHPEMLNALFHDFAKGTTDASAAALQQEVNRTFATGSLNHAVLSSCVRFVASIRRSNFFKVGRAAVCYRLDPAITLQGLEFPRTPFGIYLVVGSDFRGFHIRFHDIARGGIRLIVSANEALHLKNRRLLFQENYNLALTQTLKNKDIPESGSKGTILVSMRCPRNQIHYKRNFMQYIDSVLDNMLESEGVRDSLKHKEILFLGPDERTAGEFPTVAAKHARARGWPMWKSLTTGKDPSFGGIPHDVDGMTTRSVRENVMGIYRKLNLDGSKLVKFMTGGPDGDLGANEIKQGVEQIRGICDGTASLVDPDNINLGELRRLADGHHSLDQFDTSKLGPNAQYVLVSDKNTIRGPDGEMYANGEDFRNKFHFHPWNRCDTFVPCGGRPGAVTISNVNQFLVDAPGVTGDMMLTGGANIAPHQLRFKYICEGANLFITHDARIALEKCGVILLLDQVCNKGGVTSSSIEVLTGLALTDEQHAEHMCVKDEKSPPAFYSDLKRDIISRVEQNARMEFECIWNDSVNRRGPELGGHGSIKTLIANSLARKIVEMNEFIMCSTLHEDKDLFRYVIREYCPKTLFQVVSMDDLIDRVPPAYLRAIFSKTIASHFVYSVGCQANEFAFFEYMRKLIRNAREANRI